jgi:hypothetical protein
MNFKNFVKFTSVVLTSIFSIGAFAKGKGAGPNVSLGVAYTAQTDAVIMNSANLAQGSKVHVAAGYLGETEAVQGSLGFLFGKVGVGTVYRYYTGDTSPINPLVAGLGFNLGKVSLGFAVNTDDGFADQSYDAGLTIDLGKIRIAGNFKGLEDSLTAFRAGIGFTSGQIIFEFDAEKASPFGEMDATSPYVLDASLGFIAGPLTIVVGTDFSYDSDNSFDNFDFHGQLDWQIGKSFALNGGWRALPGYLTTGDEYYAGIRATF